MNLPDPMILSERQGLTVLGQPGWLLKVKWDGWRLVAGVVGGRVQIRTRGGADYTRVFPEIVHALSILPGGPHILDGEGIVLDGDGRSDFDRFQDSALPRVPPRKSADPVVLLVFDALMIDGQALVEQPVEDRKARLRQLLQHAGDTARVVDDFPWEQGRDLYRQAKALQLEGLVAKRLGSPYRPGERTEGWQKIKVPGAVPAQRFRR